MAPGFDREQIPAIRGFSLSLSATTVSATGSNGGSPRDRPRRSPGEETSLESSEALGAALSDEDRSQDRRTAHPACPVLHPAARRRLRDEKSLSSDSRADRAARMAPDGIENPTRGPVTMRNGRAKPRGCPWQGRRTVPTHDHGAADGTGTARMTSVNVPERMTSWATGWSARSTPRRRVEVGPSWKSRLTGRLSGPAWTRQGLPHAPAPAAQRRAVRWTRRWRHRYSEESIAPAFPYPMSMRRWPSIPRISGTSWSGAAVKRRAWSSQALTRN